jgi:hypothetical protein
VRSGGRRFRGRERVEARGNRQQDEDGSHDHEPKFAGAANNCRASLGWTAEGDCPYAGSLGGLSFHLPIRTSQHGRAHHNRRECEVPSALTGYGCLLIVSRL